MKTNRPVYLNLLQFRFPVTAISSILHRASGVVIFLLIPLLLWTLHASLSSPARFEDIQEFLLSPWLRFGLWLVISSIIYHTLAGFRHLLMDVGLGEDYKTGRRSAYAVHLLALILIILTGIWLW